jgi:hypothetical protein
MERQWLRIFISLALIGFGVLVLLNNLNLLPFDVTGMQWFWLAVFGTIGLVFLGVYASNRQENWWAVIPGFTMIGLAILISNIIPPAYAELSGGVFLGAIGLAFWFIYFSRREFWWAIIPAGVLTTLAFVASLSGQVGGNYSGAAFFIGLALTFLVVYVTPTPEGRMAWAIFPAGILGVLGLFLLLGVGDLARFFWPVALILFGLFMVFQAMRLRTK